MKTSQKRKEKKERKERLYRPRSAGERAAGRRAALFGMLTLLLCLLLIAGAVLAFILTDEPAEEEQATATEAHEQTYRYTVVIDPGHGGGSIGELLSEDLAECDYTMALAEEIAALLREEGCEVIFTRKTDMEKPITDEERIKNVTEGDCMISLHTCVEKGVYYSLLSDTTEYSSYFAEYFGTPTAESEHTITRPTSVPCVLLGIDESADAGAIADGIIGYLEKFVK